MSKEEKFKKTLQQLLDEQQFAFTESDWEAAKKVLDDKRRKKRLLPLWFTLTGLVIFICTITLWPEAKPMVHQGEKHSEQNHLAPISKLEPIAVQNNSNNATLNPTANSSNKVLAITKNKVSAPVQQTTNPLSASLSNEVSFSTNEVTTEKQEPVSIVEAKGKIKKTELSVVSLIPAVTENLNTQEDDKGISSTEKIAGEIPAMTAPFLTPDTNSSAPAEKTNMPSNDVVSNASAMPKDSSELKTVSESALPALEEEKKMLWSVEAGFNVLYGWKNSYGTEGRGFNPVLGINYHKAISERFDYSLGLHFTSIAHLGAFSDTSKVTKYNFGEESQVIVISPQTFYYLNFPLRFSWNIKNKHYFGTNLELGYLLNVKSTVETYEESFTISEKQTSKEYGYIEGVAPINFQFGLFYRRKIFNNLYLQPELFFGLVDLKDNAFFNSSTKERSSGLKLTLLYSIKNR